MNHTLGLSILASLSLLATPADAADIVVMISGGFKTSYEALSPAFEQATGNRLITVPGPSMGTTSGAIPIRLARGEQADVVVMVGYALDDLVKKGEVDPDSKVDLALSPIGMAVRTGADLPDISTVARLRATLLSAKSVAYSDSASGVYVESVLFKKLGIEEQMRGKAHKIEATPVGEIVAEGKAQLGFQEVAELLPVHGIAFAGRLPDEVQLLTMYSAAVTRRSKHPALAQQLVDYLALPKALPVIEKMGLEPMSR